MVPSFGVQQRRRSNTQAEGTSLCRTQTINHEINERVRESLVVLLMMKARIGVVIAETLASSIAAGANAFVISTLEDERDLLNEEISELRRALYRPERHEMPGRSGSPGINGVPASFGVGAAANTGHLAEAAE